MNLMKTVVAAAVALGAASVVAAPIVDNNVRPVTVNGSSLQNFFNLGGGSGGPGSSFAGKLVSDQSQSGLFRGDATPTITSPTLMLEGAGVSAGSVFGIWFGTDTGSMKTYDLLLGPATPVRAVTIDIRPGLLEVFGSSTACAGLALCGTYSDAQIDPGRFGFYFKNGTTVGYSIDAINGSTRFLSYQGGTSTNWIFAFEDGTDNNFSDMIVRVESIQKVSAPGTLALLGLGLLGVGAARRRRTA